jgi:hypothetical protein
MGFDCSELLIVDEAGEAALDERRERRSRHRDCRTPKSHLTLTCVRAFLFEAFLARRAKRTRLTGRKRQENAKRTRLDPDLRFSYHRGRTVIIMRHYSRSMVFGDPERRRPLDLSLLIEANRAKGRRETGRGGGGEKGKGRGPNDCITEI